MADVQTERAFQKQGATFLGRKRLFSSKKHGFKVSKTKKKDTVRYWRDIGLGYKTPSEAIKGHYIDKKCPFTSDVSIRGRILKGIVHSNKMKGTIIVRRHYLHYIPKYNRFEKRHTNIAAHCSPAFRVKEGDYVTIGQCRKLAKTVSFNVIKHDPQPPSGQQKKFVLF
eukprot:TRINITY_DN345_c0_g1_i1.p1 TRINITY_DN345_c0_g1~~TRINITY_DN345_c0_g1_i1.p1  ORF type:complete len:168 (-),score=22.04 TRINITY_DN345_c0_g1_i1:54-557(-)